MKELLCGCNLYGEVYVFHLDVTNPQAEFSAQQIFGRTDASSTTHGWQMTTQSCPTSLVAFKRWQCRR